MFSLLPKDLPSGRNCDFHHCWGDIIPHYGYFLNWLCSPRACTSVEFPQQLFQLVPSVKTLSCFFADSDFVPRPGLWGWGGQQLGCAATLCKEQGRRVGARQTPAVCVENRWCKQGLAAIGMWYQSMMFRYKRT